MFCFSYYVNANGYYEQLVNQSDGSASWSSWLGQVLSSESDQRPLWSDVSGLVVADEFLPHISSVTVLSAQEFQDVLILSDDEFNTNVMVKVGARIFSSIMILGSWYVVDHWLCCNQSAIDLNDFVIFGH